MPVGDQGGEMQRASTIFGLVIFLLWLIVLAVGLAYIVVWAATRRRPQWKFLKTFGAKAKPVPLKLPLSERPSAEIIPFDREIAERRRKSA